MPFRHGGDTYNIGENAVFGPLLFPGSRMVAGTDDNEPVVLSYASLKPRNWNTVLFIGFIVMFFVLYLTTLVVSLPF